MATIMIVDDSNFTRRTHRRILESGGHVVHEAASGMSAIEGYFVHRPDLVLLDLTMEDMSGLEVLEQLRAMEADSRVIVIQRGCATLHRAGRRASLPCRFWEAGHSRRCWRFRAALAGWIVNGERSSRRAARAVNIGLHRAAASLSCSRATHLVGCRALDCSDRGDPTRLLKCSTVTGAVTRSSSQRVRRRPFWSPVNSAAQLASLLTNCASALGGRRDHSAREVLTKSQCHLSSCLIAFGDIGVDVTFRYRSSKCNRWMDFSYPAVDRKTCTHLLSATRFRLSETESVSTC